MGRRRRNFRRKEKIIAKKKKRKESSKLLFDFRLENIKEAVSSGNFKNKKLKFYTFTVSDDAAEISAKYGYLPYIIERYLRMFGKKETVELLEANEKVEKIYIRVNTLKSDPRTVITALERKGYTPEPDDEIPYALFIEMDYDNNLPVGSVKSSKKSPKQTEDTFTLSYKPESHVRDYGRDRNQLEMLEWGKPEKEVGPGDKKSEPTLTARKKMRSFRTEKFKEKIATLGSLDEYLRGYYYIQDKASMLPVIYLNPQPGDLVVDMCAAPGGKTTHLAQLMDNTGKIVAVEIDKSRIMSLIYNLRRCGVRNTIVIHDDAHRLSKLELSPDRILLDAPCSGEGVIRQDPTRKFSRRPSDISYLMHKQAHLLREAVKSVKPGGYIMYSTCSIAPEENEFVIQNILEQYPKIETVPVNDDIGLPGFTEVFGVELHESLINARRYYPHIHGTIGFFYCLLHKKV